MPSIGKTSGLVPVFSTYAGEDHHGVNLEPWSLEFGAKIIFVDFILGFNPLGQFVEEETGDDPERHD